MLKKQDRPTRLDDPPDFSEGFHRMCHRTEAAGGENSVEGGVREWELLNVGLGLPPRSRRWSFMVFIGATRGGPEAFQP